MSSSTLISDYLAEGTATPTLAPPVASGVAAAFYDKVAKKLYIYNWATPGWDAVGGGGGFNPFSAAAPVAPTAASLTLAQSANLSGAATLTNLASGRGVQLAVPMAASNIHYSATAGVAAPSTTAMTIKCLLHKNWINIQSADTWGVFIKDTAGKILNLVLYGGASGTMQLNMGTQSALGTPTANIWSSNMALHEPSTVPFWAKMQISSGNLISSLSWDGETFQQIDTRTVASLSSFFNGTPATCGFFLDIDNTITTNPGTMATRYFNCYEFDATTP